MHPPGLILCVVSLDNYGKEPSGWTALCEVECGSKDDDVGVEGQEIQISFVTCLALNMNKTYIPMIISRKKSK